MPLNKVTVMTIIAAIFSVVRVVLPDLPIPEGLEEGLAVVVMFIVGFFVSETRASVGRLTLKG